MKLIKILVPLVYLVSCQSSTKEIAEKEGSERKDTVIQTNQKNTNTVEDGRITEYYPDGTIKIKGQMKDGRRNGLWTSYYQNGNKWSENYYVSGEKKGHTVTFYSNGSIRYVGEYKNDQKTGEWKFYDESGQMIKVENY